MGVTTGPSLDFSVWTAHWSWGIRKSIDLKRYCWPQNVILVHPLTISLQLRQKWSVFKRHNQCLPRQGKAGRPHSASLSSCTQSGSPWTMWKMAIRSRENILLSSPIKKSTIMQHSMMLKNRQHAGPWDSLAASSNNPHTPPETKSHGLSTDPTTTVDYF